MIHLDTNFLIRICVGDSQTSLKLQNWIASGQPLGTSSISWAEFLFGPLAAPDLEIVRSLVGENLAPFTPESAQIAASLFNSSGRKRGTQIDCMIAASAIQAGALLATHNSTDFRQFVPYGLRLI